MDESELFNQSMLTDRIGWHETMLRYQLVKTRTKFYDHNQQLDVIIKNTNFNSWACFYQDVQEKEIYSITDVLE